VYTVDHSKVDALASTLEAHFAEKPEDRVLVFANIRATAEVLVDRLRDRGYRAALFIGRAEGKHGPRMSQDEQMKTLRPSGRVCIMCWLLQVLVRRD
jgi:ERCC4-related helicase